MALFHLVLAARERGVHVKTIIRCPAKDLAAMLDWLENETWLDAVEIRDPAVGELTPRERRILIAVSQIIQITQFAAPEAVAVHSAAEPDRSAA